MVRVRLLTVLSGPGRFVDMGEAVELDPMEAARLLDRGLAEYAVAARPATRTPRPRR